MMLVGGFRNRMPTSESGSNNLHYSWELADIVSNVPDDDRMSSEHTQRTRMEQYLVFPCSSHKTAQGSKGSVTGQVHPSIVELRSWIPVHHLAQMDSPRVILEVFIREL